MLDNQEQGMTISNQCYECMVIERDKLEGYAGGNNCQSCQEDKEAKGAQVAYELVDEGNLQYKHIWINITEPSGHDWTEREGEYRLPIVFLQDGGIHEEYWELDDYAQRQRETVCQWCNILTPKLFNDCQSCDKPLENNLIS